MVSEFCSPQDLGYVHSIPDALKLVPPHTLAKRVWLTKSQFSLLNIYFRLSGPSFLSLCIDAPLPSPIFSCGEGGWESVHRLLVPILILLHYGPNTCSQYAKVSRKAKNLSDMWRSTFRDRRGAASPRYRNRAEITVLTSEQKPIDLLQVDLLRLAEVEFQCKRSRSDRASDEVLRSTCFA